MSDLPKGINGGWVDDPDAVAEITALQPYETFGDTPAGQVEDVPAFVFGWKVYEKVMGKSWPARSQGQVGSCVSFGTVAAIEYTMVSEIARGEPEAFSPLSQEVIYAGSRVEVGRGRVRGDGSVGAWAAEFVKQWGVLPREIVGKYDLREYNEKRCREWGNTGVPDDIEPLAKLHPIHGVTKVTTVEQAQRAIASGYGISVCSNQGFTMRRDEKGFATATGRWAHCMAIIGYQTDKGLSFWICNSWGTNTMTGPVGAGDPPPCGFWAEGSVVARMLAAGDSWAFSDAVGFPAKSIPWII